MDDEHSLTQRVAAEFLGTFVLVFGGCGAAVLAAGVPDVGIGFLGVAFAFGLTVLTMAYAVGHVSGGHFNPAVTLGLALAGRFRWRDVLPYAVTQVVAAIAAAAVLFVVANGKSGFSAEGVGLRHERLRRPLTGGLLAAGRARRSRSCSPRSSCTSSWGRPTPARPRASRRSRSASSLTLIHLASIPVSNTSVNPARSTGPALFAGSDALVQLWAFWAAPLVGAAIAGATYALLFGKDKAVVPLPEATEA